MPDNYHNPNNGDDLVDDQIEESPWAPTYEIQPGETLFDIAKGYNISLPSLINANPQITDPNLLSPGQVLTLPPLTTPREIAHILKPGETLSNIANKYNVPLYVLRAVNPQIDPNLLTVGNIIYVPAPRELHINVTGKATRYLSYGKGGYCELKKMRERGYLVAAMNMKDFNNCFMCGAYVEVINTSGKSIKVLIIERSKEPKGNIDLDIEAYKKLTGTSGGRITVTWRIVPLEFKMGNKFEYLLQPPLLQIRNHRYPIGRLEYKDETGYKVLPRFKQGAEVRNYFNVKNLRSRTVTLRITSLYGTAIEEDITLIPGKVVRGKSQFDEPSHYL